MAVQSFVDWKIIATKLNHPRFFLNSRLQEQLYAGVIALSRLNNNSRVIKQTLISRLLLVTI